MSQTHEKSGWLKRFLAWLFGAPFRELPPEFGNPVPTELQVFEYQAEEAEHHARSRISTRTPDHHKQTKPIQRDESLERE